MMTRARVQLAILLVGEDGKEEGSTEFGEYFQPAADLGLVEIVHLKEVVYIEEILIKMCPGSSCHWF